ncbi:MAG: FAD-dependent oxidoreductase [Rubricoccaceae bacterium]
MRIAVIGGLAAGPAAASEAKRTNPDAEVVLFEQGEHISVGACEIPYFVADRLDGTDDLIVVEPAELERTRGVTVHIRHRVTTIDPRAGTLTVDALDYGATRTERFDRFILATGARARQLGVPGADAAGVFSVRDFADALAIKQWVATEPVRHVVIVGGGYVGLEMAEAMRDRGLRATILDPKGRVLAGSLVPEMGSQLDDAVCAAGVTVRDERVTAVMKASDGRVQAVRTDAGEIIGCQAVIVAIGVEPRAELATAAGVALGETGAVRVDDQMRTSVRNVWACGDLVEVRRVIDGKAVHLALAPVGRRTARVAARNAARRGGTPEIHRGVTGAVAVKAFGIEAASVGLDLETARAGGVGAVAVQIRHTTRTAMYPGSKPIDVRLVVERGTGRLLGGQLVGAEGAALRANVLVPLLRAGTAARELAQDFDLVYNPPVAPAVDPLKVAAREAMKAANG